MLIHTVIFWLKEGMSAPERAQFLADLSGLEQIPSVKKLYVGQPSSTPERPVVDTSYDFGLTVVVENVEGHNAYSDHPIHLAFVDRWKSWFERVQIYDFE